MKEDSWQRSSYCAGGGNNCVEVATPAPHRVALRDSTRPARVVTTGRTAFHALISGICTDEI
ncbi:DUF397 domain-containing protein [Streptomyces sp. NPDC057963]|uniref:DUF397 domain-containing protein n=1 Tax=Streptomyces sp. NPDC057963 TaxID=3346290 RepID=UPI0036EAD37A